MPTLIWQFRFPPLLNAMESLPKPFRKELVNKKKARTSWPQIVLRLMLCSYKFQWYRTRSQNFASCWYHKMAVLHVRNWWIDWLSNDRNPDWAYWHRAFTVCATPKFELTTEITIDKLKFQESRWKEITTSRSGNNIGLTESAKLSRGQWSNQNVRIGPTRSNGGGVCSNVRAVLSFTCAVKCSKKNSMIWSLSSSGCAKRSTSDRRSVTPPKLSTFCSPLAGAMAPLLWSCSVVLLLYIVSIVMAHLLFQTVFTFTLFSVQRHVSYNNSEQ